MRPIPPALRRKIAERPEMYRCAKANEDCRDEYGNPPRRAEWEHAFDYAGRQINEWWALIGVCWFHHRGPGMDKRFNQYACLNRVGDEDMARIQRKYPNVRWDALKKSLQKQYGGEDR